MQLPEQWVTGLTEGKRWTPRAKGVRMTSKQTAAWLAERPTGDMCRCFERLVARAAAQFAQYGADGAHDQMTGVVWGLIRDARDGHRGVESALAVVQRAFFAEVSNRRTEKDAESEWSRSVDSAIKKVSAEDAEPSSEDPCDLARQWQPTVADEEIASRFALVSAAELAKPVPPMRWLVKGVWPEKSHGPLAGAKKSLKSWNALALAVSVASGVPYLGQFDVHESGPVLIFSGEGGQDEFQRRYQRICEAYGVDPASLPLSVTFDVGSLSGKPFQTQLRSHIEALKPALVILDPLYTYHPEGIEAQNLYERGRMLGELSKSVGHDTALVVVDHYRKTGGSNLDLDEIGQSGVAQWADSWILQAHREAPDLDAGAFRLKVQYGSRRWGSRDWAIDWDCPFDYELGEPSGDIAWSVDRTEGRGGNSKPRKPFDSEVDAAFLDLLERQPWEHTTAAAQALVLDEFKERGATRAQVRDAWTRLSAKSVVVSASRPGREGKNRQRWAVNPDPVLKIGGEVPARSE